MRHYSNYAIFNLFNTTFKRFLSSNAIIHTNTPRAFISDTQTIATLPGMHPLGPKPLFTGFSGSRGLLPKPPNCGVAHFRWRSTVNLCRVCQWSKPIYCNSSKWSSCAMLEVRHLLLLKLFRSKILARVSGRPGQQTQLRSPTRVTFFSGICANLLK